MHNSFSFNVYFPQITKNKSYSWQGLGLREVPVTTCHKNPQFQLQCAPFPPELNLIWSEFSSLLGLNKVWKEHPHFCSSEVPWWTPAPVWDRDTTAASSCLHRETTASTFRQLVNFFAKQRLIHLGNISASPLRTIVYSSVGELCTSQTSPPLRQQWQQSHYGRFLFIFNIVP